MRELTTYGQIVAGVLKISRRDRFMGGLSAWPDCRVLVTVRKIYRRRSSQQNAYLHGVVIPEVCRGLIENGYSSAECTQESVKEFLKHRFAVKEIANESTGEVLAFVQPTSQMTTTELMEFIERVRQFAGEYLGVYIPAPNEQMTAF